MDLDGIVNPAAFVQDAIGRTRLRIIDPHEREELVAEGLLILCELAAAYDPARDRNPDPATGGMVGYAHYLLPRRLIAAWHRLHPEHRYGTDPASGRRTWITDPAPVSLDRVLAGDDGQHRDDRRFTPLTHASPPRAA